MKLLSELEFQFLAILETSERSGREIAHAYKVETGKTVSYGSLYTTFRRLREEGYVNMRDDDDGDGRVRYFTITGSGLRAIRATRDHYLNLANFGSTLPSTI